MSRERGLRCAVTGGEGAKGVGRRVEERGRKPRRSGPGRGEGKWNRVTDGPAWTGRPCVRGDSLAIPHPTPKLSDDLSGRRGRTDRQGSEGPPAARAHLLGAEAAGRLVTLGGDTSELRRVCRLGGVSRRDPGEVAAKGPPARPRASRHRGVLGGSGGARGAPWRACAAARSCVAGHAGRCFCLRSSLSLHWPLPAGSSRPWAANVGTVRCI